ncbi:TPA: ead/Ea22-like family protein [Escherichia coli]
MKQMSLIEMDGFLKGKCIPQDLKVNETNAEYLVRKFAEAEAKISALSEDQQRAIESIKQADAAVKLAHEKFSALAAENELARKAVQAFCDVVGDNTEVIAEVVGRDGVLVILEAMKATGNMPATDAFLAEVRASSIPEGYVLVPQQIFLEPSDIESICSQCGDGHESGYGDFTNGLLWVGNIQCDDGSIVHGLHISSADYSEEGGVTVCEFAAQLRKGGNQ